MTSMSCGWYDEQLLTTLRLLYSFVVYLALNVINYFAQFYAMKSFIKALSRYVIKILSTKYLFFFNQLFLNVSRALDIFPICKCE